MLAIIDADTIVYKAAGAAQKKDKETGELIIEPLSFALNNAKLCMENIIEKTECDDYCTYLTEAQDLTCFRTKLYSLYKANRKDLVRPKWYHEVREYLIKTWKAEVVATIEADDAVCIRQWKEDGPDFEIETCNSILCGIDKDLNQVPGLHFNYNTNELYFITKIEALRHFYLQILTGDRVDNIPRIVKGWRQGDTERLIMLATTEEELYRIVSTEIENLYIKEKAHYSESIIAQEIQWKADLLYLRRKSNDRYSFIETLYE